MHPSNLISSENASDDRVRSAEAVDRLGRSAGKGQWKWPEQEQGKRLKGQGHLDSQTSRRP